MTGIFIYAVTISVSDLLKTFMFAYFCIYHLNYK